MQEGKKPDASVASPLFTSGRRTAGRGVSGGPTSQGAHRPTAVVSAPEERIEDGDAELNEGEDEAILLQEALAAQAVERLIAAGREDDGNSGGLVDAVAREAALALSSNDEEPIVEDPRGLPKGALPRPGQQNTSAACARSMLGISVAVRGQNQKEQMSVVEGFRRGEINVLVATCIAEEGLVSEGAMLNRRTAYYFASRL